MGRGAWWATICEGCKESDTTEVTEHAHTECVCVCVCVGVCVCEIILDISSRNQIL